MKLRHIAVNSIVTVNNWSYSANPHTLKMDLSYLPYEGTKEKYIVLKKGIFFGRCASINNLHIKSVRDGNEYYIKSDFVDPFIEIRRMFMKKKPWVRFYFEGNLAWGWINTPEDWEKIKHEYKNQFDPSSAKSYNNDRFITRDYPSFGFYSEYTGETTLADWAKENNMKL